MEKSNAIIYVEGNVLTGKSQVMREIKKLFPTVGGRRVSYFFQESRHVSDEGDLNYYQAMLNQPDMALYYFDRLIRQKIKGFKEHLESDDVNHGDIVIVESSIYYIYFVLRKFLHIFFMFEKLKYFI